MEKIIQFAQENLLEKGVLPDSLIRFGIRQKLKEKLIVERKENLEFRQARFIKLVNSLKASPIAIDTRAANEQHYEVPTEFFQYVMGKHMKYSSCYYRGGVKELDRAEEDMLHITCERADLINGQHILELGCGWGSLSLFMAATYPQSKIVGVSNSATQKAYIDTQAEQRGLKNLTIITADMNDFQIHEKFDRVVSVEMFEHMRNYQKLLEKVSGFLNKDGKLFVHIFTHKEFAYLYETQDESDWIGRYFFTGGVMPSDDLLLYFQDHFKIDDHWQVSGVHYQKTSEAWLKNMDQHKKEIMPIFEKVYGKDQAKKWWVYWRVFFMSCAELWGYDKGREWIVSHYLFCKR